MCWTWRKKKKPTINISSKQLSPISNDSCNGDINVHNYYSPYCTKRPLYASKICQNCKSVFYNYLDKSYCSKECKFSKMLSGYNSN